MPSEIAELSFTNEAKREMRFTWWSGKYHFTTDGLGEFADTDQFIKDNPNRENPIGELPFVSMNKDQDEQYFSLGGQDLADGTILINVLLTDLNYILFYQGMGVFYASGDGLPDKVRVGPNSALVFKPKQEGAANNVKVGFATSNPPVDSHLRNIEQQLAILLSTNNLEPSGVATALSKDSATSGIHELIKRADVTEAIEDSQDFFVPAEQAINRIAAKWLNDLIKKNLADTDCKNVGSMDPMMKISVEYKPPAVLLSETERVNTIQQKLGIPLMTMIDAVKEMNPDLSDEEAVMRVQELESDYKRRQTVKTPPGLAGAAPGQPGAKDPATKVENQAGNLAAGSDGG
jgi:hypothetical protein